MTWRSIFNSPLPVRHRSLFPAGGGDGSAPPQESQGVFVTPQSLPTFAGASMVVALTWKALGTIDESWGRDQLAALICALIVGAVLFVISQTDPKRGPRTLRDHMVDGFVAVVNVLVLFVAAVGGTHLG